MSKLSNLSYCFLVIISLFSSFTLTANKKKDPPKDEGTCCLECMYPLVHSEFPQVKIYHTPWVNNFTGFCKNVFNRDGSCCDTDSLENYSEMWIASIEKRLNDTLIDLPNFRSALTSISQLRKFMKKKKKDILKAKKKISKEQYEDFEKHVLTSMSEGVFSFYRKEEKANLLAK